MTNGLSFAWGLLCGFLAVCVLLSLIGYSPNGVKNRVTNSVCQERGATDGYYDFGKGRVICRTVTYSEAK